MGRAFWVIRVVACSSISALRATAPSIWGRLARLYGAIGGFVAASSHIIEVRRLLCPAHGFPSMLPPDQVMTVDRATDIVADEPERCERLWANQHHLFLKLRQLPCMVVSNATPIVPLLIGHETDAIRLAVNLRKRSFHVDPIKFPAVAFGGARIRIQLNTDHTRRHIDDLVDALSRNRGLLEAGALPHSLDFNLERARAWTAQPLQAALDRIPPSTRKMTLPKA